MICTPIPGGFACGPRPRFKLCACGSGLKANLLCDWKLEDGRTCNAKICAGCSTKPAPDKDLCQAHARAWIEWRTARAAAHGG